MTEEAFVSQIRKYGRAMFRAARSLCDSDAEAEDAVGRAVLTAFERRHSLRNEEAARAWLVKIAVNCALEDRRRRSRVTYLEDLPELPAPERQESLREAVAALPEIYRSVVTLYYYEGFSTGETAKILGISRGTVMSRLSRARDALKRMLEEDR